MRISFILLLVFCVQVGSTQTQVKGQTSYVDPRDEWKKIKAEYSQGEMQVMDWYAGYLDSRFSEDSILRKAIGKEVYYKDELKSLTAGQQKIRDTLFANMPFGGKTSNQSALEMHLQNFKKNYVSRLQEWHLLDIQSLNVYGIGLKKAYSELLRGKKGDTVVVAVMDSRLDTTHENLKSVLWHHPERSPMTRNQIEDNLLLDGGTHVAGVIGATMNRRKGIKIGIANAVKIMDILAMSSGDEYDRDMALAIRYAVDNGAKVINMSFAKELSPNRDGVEEAIKYAAERDVLVVNGAGNSKRNIDSLPIFPIAKYRGGDKSVPNMITVGASGPTKDNLIANFSNYGQAVDVFAPGLDIYSTLPDNSYGKMSGTRVAASVVAGIAALIRSYYPKLSAEQVKYIIENSVTKIDFPVKKPGTQEMVLMMELCRTGGIVNAYNAVKLAESLP